MTRDALRPVPPRTDPELSISRTFDAARPRARSRSPGSAEREPERERRERSTPRSVFPARSPPRRASRCPGALQCHAASAADGNPATAWNTPFVGVGGQWVQFQTPQPITFSQHAPAGRGRRPALGCPTSIELQVDGSVRDADAPAHHAAPCPRTRPHGVPLHFPAMTGRTIRVTITGVQPQLATRESTGDTVTAPVGIAELGIPGLRVGDGAGRAARRVPFRPARRSTAGRAGARHRPGERGVADSTASRLTPCDPRDPTRMPTITLGARPARGAHVGGCAHRRADRSPRARVGGGWRRRSRSTAGG